MVDFVEVWVAPVFEAAVGGFPPFVAREWSFGVCAGSDLGVAGPVLVSRFGLVVGFGLLSCFGLAAGLLGLLVLLVGQEVEVESEVLADVALHLDL